MACLTYLSHTMLAAGGMFSRGQPKPGGKMSPGLKVRWVHAQCHRDRGDWSNAWNCGEEPAHSVSLVLFEQLFLQHLDLRIEISDVLAHLLKHRLCHR
jgi:hypothetical protein